MNPGRRRTVVGRAVLAILGAGVLAQGCAGTPPPGRPAPGGAEPATDPAEWIDEVLPRLSLEDRVAQLIVVAGDGALSNPHSPAARQLERYVDELHVGGILVGAGTPVELALRLNALQQRAPLPLLVAADAEAGLAAVLPPVLLPGPRLAGGATVLPTSMGLAATGAPLSAELAGRVTGREARAVGIHWLLGPIVDVSPAEGAVLARSFSSDAALVARYADAWVRGARTAGTLTTLRHFPGEGATRPGADAAPKVVEKEPAALERHELVPFGAVLRSGTDAIMVGHAAVPAYTGDRTTPAALAPEIGRDLLRRRLGFEGLIVTAPLSQEMLRSVPSLSPGEVAVRALLAGADVLLAPADPALTHRAVVTAVRSGRLSYRRIDESVRRILLAKARLDLPHARLADIDSVATRIGAPEHEDIAARLAAESITLVRDSLGLVPIDPRRNHRIALIALAGAEQLPAGARLAAELRDTYGTGATYDRLSPRTADSIVDAAVTRAGRAQRVVLAVFAPADTAERSAVARRARLLAQRIAALNPALILAGFGDPAVVGGVTAPHTLVLAWQPAGEHAQVALARALSGRAMITGRLPVALAQTALGTVLQRAPLDFRLELTAPEKVGMDPATLARINGLVIRALAGGASPGAAVAIGRHGKLVHLRGYGRLDLSAGYDVVTDSSIYDLASLTKVIGTTSALAMLVDRGWLDLDAPVQRYIPEWKGSAAKEAVTLRNLVLHNSGLAAYGPLYQTLRGREEYRRRIAGMELSYAPGTRTVYSDFGIILLGFIIEQVSGQPLDAFLERELFGPLGMRDTGFNPLHWPYTQVPLENESGQSAPPYLLYRIAPTEMDTLFRFTRMHGRVHDENAFAIGGVAGHAGLFSSARDLAVFAQLMLDRGFYGGRRYFDPATVAQFTRRQSEASSRGIGWDTPSESSSAGDYFTEASFGHTGFTGTSIWVDPEREVFVVLLTNRVNFGRDNQKHVPLRSALADLVQQAIRDQPVTPRGGTRVVGRDAGN